MSTIDEYLEGVNPQMRDVLNDIRRVVHELVPEAQESISYGVPTFKVKDRPLLYFAAYKNHMSIHPQAGDELRAKLKDYKTAKGTIQFTLEHPLPDGFIEEFIHYRLSLID